MDLYNIFFILSAACININVFSQLNGDLINDTANIRIYTVVNLSK